MDQWNGVKQDEVTAGIGCQSVTGPRRTGPVRRLSYHLHYQEEQLPAATGEKPHAMDRAGVERQSWTTNELKGQ